MIYVNECTDCGGVWDDDGKQYWYLMDVERADPGLSVEPVLCDSCLVRIVSCGRAGTHALLCLSSTLNLKKQPECPNCKSRLDWFQSVVDGEHFICRQCNGQFVFDTTDDYESQEEDLESAQHDAGDNSEMVSDKENNDIQGRSRQSGEDELDWIHAQRKQRRQQKANHKND